jgi:hypothetical protein
VDLEGIASRISFFSWLQEMILSTILVAGFLCDFKLKLAGSQTALDRLKPL